MFRARFWPMTARPARPIREREADSMVVGLERENCDGGRFYRERERERVEMEGGSDGVDEEVKG